MSRAMKTDTNTPPSQLLFQHTRESAAVSSHHHMHFRPGRRPEVPGACVRASQTPAHSGAVRRAAVATSDLVMNLEHCGRETRAQLHPACFRKLVRPAAARAPVLCAHGSVVLLTDHREAKRHDPLQDRRQRYPPFVIIALALVRAGDVVRGVERPRAALRPAPPRNLIASILAGVEAELDADVQR